MSESHTALLINLHDCVLNSLSLHKHHFISCWRRGKIILSRRFLNLIFRSTQTRLLARLFALFFQLLSIHSCLLRLHILRHTQLIHNFQVSGKTSEVSNSLLVHKAQQLLKLTFTQLTSSSSWVSVDDQKHYINLNFHPFLRRGPHCDTDSSLCNLAN